ncbi:hypothetical protein E2P81_ATG02358 [Venturia nashicola]|nr:hypothetical protein E2P81_ATG02358 [Venturia nashicola]
MPFCLIVGEKNLVGVSISACVLASRPTPQRNCLEWSERAEGRKLHSLQGLKDHYHIESDNRRHERSYEQAKFPPIFDNKSETHF